MNPWLIIGGMASTVLLCTVTYLQGHSDGVEAEELKWQSANVETLQKGNTALADHIKSLNDKAADDTLRDVEASGNITRVETRIIEKIVEVPVETVIKVGDDCRLDYDIVRLRNGWASGRGLDPAAVPAPSGYLPDVGTETLPGNLAGAAD